MRSIAWQDPKERLAERVAEAEAGVTLLVTDRDRIVAELVPPREVKPSLASRPPGEQWLSDDEAIALGHREGWLTPATRFGAPAEPTYPAIMSFDDLMGEIARDREDR